MIKNAIILSALTMLCGCSSVSSQEKGRNAPEVVQIQVVAGEEHFGHNNIEGDVHTVWCDGYKTRLLPSGESFAIYWINNSIKVTPFRFKENHKYAVTYTGELGTGVMGYQGKCIDVRQIVKLEEQ